MWIQFAKKLKTNKKMVILADMFEGNHTMQFGLINFHTNEDLKETLVGMMEPKIVMIKDGKVLTTPMYKESYN